MNAPTLSSASCVASTQRRGVGRAQSASTHLLHCTVLVCVVAGVWTLGSGDAFAQPIEAGVNATPTVTILFDTSGSMEWLDNEDEYPVCLTSPAEYPGLTGPCTLDTDCSLGQTCERGRCAFIRSRYHTAVEVLTGSIENYYPVCEDRSQDSSRIDQLPSSPPQGIRHTIACSSDGTLGGTFADECYRTPDGSTIAPPGFRQADDGLIDLYGSFIYFGFMAFDSFPDASQDGRGMWSYGAEGISPTPGANPQACASASDCWNLGGRRPGADVPGATIAPLDPSDDSITRRAQINQETQNSIRSIVPYWSTPIGAILEDALTFHAIGDEGYYSWYAANVPGAVNGEFDYSRGLPDLYAECRKRYVILITDGLPTYYDCVRRGDSPSNDAWSTGCEGYWYKNAEYYAARLLDQGVTTYVIGFNIVEPVGSEGLALERLGRIAEAGGTDEVFFADGSRELLFQLGDILTQIASGTPSRTRPATTTRLSGSRIGEYRFQAFFEIKPESKYWTGNIQRLSWECAGGELQSEPTIEDVASRLDLREPSERRILTASPNIHSCALSQGGNPMQSLFPAGSASPGTLENAVYGVTRSEIADVCMADGQRPSGPSTVPDSCTDLTDGNVTFNDEFNESNTALSSRCLANLSVDRGDANPLIFGADSAIQSRMFIRWLRGETLTELRADFAGELDDFLPANVLPDPISGVYPRDRTSSLADIFHSAPVVLGQPDRRVSLSDDYLEFAEEASTRPTMVYVGTNDGLLHAFDAETLKEEWAFLPASFSTRIAEWIGPGHTFMFDGSPVVADVALDRRVADSAVDGEWASVLISGYRGGGRGFIALDVTDPLNPGFLWELDAELDPQLGFTYSEPAIGTVLLQTCVGASADESCERAVAILGGGRPPVGASPFSNIGKLIYVVDVKTGTVLRRFTHLTDTNGSVIPIPHPVTGAVAAFDTFAGSLVTRAFVGDSQGNLLRVDLTSSDPDDWRVDMFIRPLESIAPPTSPTAPPQRFGEVRFRPTISVDAEYRAVVVYGMGNVDELDDVQPDVQHYVISATETPRFDDDGNLERVDGEINWALELEPFEKMTSRPTVFNRRAFFATFTPTAENLCDIGGARLYAFDYIGPNPGGGYVGTAACSDSTFQCYLTENAGDLEPSPSNPLVPFWDSDTEGTGILPKSIIYSLEVVQRATCFVEEDVDDGTRGEFGGTTRLSEMSGGEYELQFASSSYVAPPEGSVDASPEAVSQVNSVALPVGQPMSIPTSWTVIFE